MTINDTITASGEALDARPYRQRFIEAMDDDFNTPQALASLFDLAKAINQARDTGLSFAEAQKVLSELARDILGLKQRDVIIEVPTGRITIKTYAPTVEIGVQPTPEALVRVSRLAEERSLCRKAKNWQRADEIRTKLGELGIVLEDTSDRPHIVWTSTPAVEALDKLLAELGIYFQDAPPAQSGSEKDKLT